MVKLTHIERKKKMEKNKLLFIIYTVIDHPPNSKRNMWQRYCTCCHTSMENIWKYTATVYREGVMRGIARREKSQKICMSKSLYGTLQLSNSFLNLVQELMHFARIFLVNKYDISEKLTKSNF